MKIKIKYQSNEISQINFRTIFVKPIIYTKELFDTALYPESFNTVLYQDLDIILKNRMNYQSIMILVLLLLQLIQFLRFMVR